MARKGDGRSAKVITPDMPLDEEQYEKRVMEKIKLILDRGNNAEIRRRSDGTLTVMEVKKQIV